MKVHYLKHHQAYTNKLNDALTELRQDPETKHFAKMGIDSLLQHLDEIPVKLRGAIRNNGGGYVNHDKFWAIMNPDGGQSPVDGSAIASDIQKHFGSFDVWKQAFIDASLKVFGSGWSWLVYNRNDGKLSIQTTLNQDTPASQPGNDIIMGLDLWEHAYYLKYQNKRNEYIENWFNLINWPEADRRLLVAKGVSLKEEL